MFFALNDQGIRIHANSADSNACYTCPACGEAVRHRKGPHNKWHFAHHVHSDCAYGKDKDYDHEWHMRMQEYFPPELREYRFVDAETNEVHIADIFIPSSKMVLEFQHSRITDDEFQSRTSFHVKNGRRIVWLFDESEEKPVPGHNGKFVSAKMNIGCSMAAAMTPYNYDSNFLPDNPYKPLFYKWLRSPRKCLATLPDLDSISEIVVICVYTGTENDLFHRLVYLYSEDSETYTTFSLHEITMKEDMDGEEFFIPEKEWQKQSQSLQWFQSFDYLKALNEEARYSSSHKPPVPRFYSRPYQRS